jgi:hypothetical protein
MKQTNIPETLQNTAISTPCRDKNFCYNITRGDEP